MKLSTFFNSMRFILNRVVFRRRNINVINISEANEHLRRDLGFHNGDSVHRVHD